MSEQYNLKKYRPAIQELCSGKPPWKKTDEERLAAVGFNYAEAFALTDDDIPALLEIAAWNGGVPDSLDDKSLAAAHYALRALPQLDPVQSSTGLLELLNHVDWQRIEYNAEGRFPYELEQLVKRSPEKIFPLFFAALKEKERHDMTRITILRSLSVLSGEYKTELRRYLLDDVNERRIGYRTWYAKAAAMLTDQNEPESETVKLIRQLCLDGTIDPVLYSNAAACYAGLQDIKLLDFENDPELLPVYKDFTAIGWIVRDFDHFEYPIHKQTFSLARKHRDKIIPTLIEIVRNQTAYGRFGVLNSNARNFYAVHILAEFQAADALPAVVESIQLDDLNCYKYVYGDILYNEMPGIVYRLAGNDLNFYKKHLLDPSSLSGLLCCLRTSLKYLIAANVLSADEYFSLLKQSLELFAPQKDKWLITCLVDDLIYSGDKQYLPLVMNLVDSGLVDEDMVDRDEAEACLSGKTGSRAAFSEDLLKLDKYTDAEKAMSRWHCFQKSKPIRKEPEVKQKEERIPMPWDDDPEISYEGVGKNEPCPCGSGKKYKVCCMKKGR